jgi:hypothetical protein
MNLCQLAEEEMMQPETSQDHQTKPEVISTVSQEITAVSPAVTQAEAEKSAKRTQAIIIASAVAFLVLLVAAVVLMASYPQATQVIRDIAIVFVAVVSFLIGLAIILLIFQVQMLIQVLRDEIQPLLQSFNDTASTVRGTTEFVSHNVVSPVIKVAGFTAAVQKVTSDLVTIITGMKPSSKSSQNQTGGKQDV